MGFSVLLYLTILETRVDLFQKLPRYELTRGAPSAARTRRAPRQELHSPVTLLWGTFFHVHWAPCPRSTVWTLHTYNSLAHALYLAGKVLRTILNRVIYTALPDVESLVPTRAYLDENRQSTPRTVKNYEWSRPRRLSLDNKVINVVLAGQRENGRRET